MTMGGTRERELAMLVVLLRGSSREIPLRARACDAPFALMVRVGRSWRLARLPDAPRTSAVALGTAYELMLALNADLERGSEIGTIREVRP